MIEIPLTQGQVTIIDDCDADLATLKWYARYDPFTNGYYAQRNNYTKEIGKSEQLHRTILSRMLNKVLERFEFVDHINLNTLDNRRENLRLATHGQNQQNGQKYTNNTSGYKGVSWHKTTNKWISNIQVNGKRIHLGIFTDIEDAAEAYRLAAIKHHGEFARYTGMEDD